MTPHEMVEAIMRECRKSPMQPPHPRFSNALGCLRAHVYDRQLVELRAWPVAIDKPVRWNFAAATGTALGAVIEAAACRLGATSQQHAVLGDVEGDLDIEWGDYVLDLKWTGDHGWKQAKIGPDPKHVAQVNGYAVARGKPRWALIYLPLFALGKGEGIEWLIHDGAADAEQARLDITERWALIDEHAHAGTLPEREWPEDQCRRLRCLHLLECRGG